MSKSTTSRDKSEALPGQLKVSRAVADRWPRDPGTKCPLASFVDNQYYAYRRGKRGTRWSREMFDAHAHSPQQLVGSTRFAAGRVMKATGPQSTPSVYWRRSHWPSSWLVSAWGCSTGKNTSARLFLRVYGPFSSVDSGVLRTTESKGRRLCLPGVPCLPTNTIARHATARTSCAKAFPQRLRTRVKNAARGSRSGSSMPRPSSSKEAAGT